MMTDLQKDAFYKVYLLHEDQTWREALFEVPPSDVKGETPFDRVRALYFGSVAYRKIILFVDVGEPDADDIKCMDVE